MCSHFTIRNMQQTINFLIKQGLPVVAKIPGEEEDFPLEVFPKTQTPVLLYENDQLLLKPLSFGYPNPFDEKKPPIFNARIERFYSEKPSMWDESFARKRCLIVAERFFESHPKETILNEKTGRKKKQQYEFKLAEADLFYMAGIYEDDHFAIVTTEPNAEITPYHDLMPLVLQPDEIRTWLFQNFTPLVDRENISLNIKKAS